MEDEIMSQEDLEAHIDPVDDSQPSDEPASDTPAEAPVEDSAPAGDKAPPEAAAKSGAKSGDEAPPAKPAEEAIPRWRLNQEIERRKQAEAERAQLMQRLTGAPQNPNETPKPAPEAAAPVPPKPSDFQDYDKYLDAREAYIEQKAEYKAKQTAAEEWTRRQQEAQTQQQNQTLHDRLQKAQRNWETSVAQATAKDPNIQHDLDAGMNIPKLAGLAAMESEDPAALIARIGKTEGLVEKIWAQSPDQQIRTIARLEAEIAQEKKQPGNGGPVKKPSASVPAVNPARLGNNQSSVDIFKGDAPMDAFTRGLFHLPKR
jgi:hypothetical protein